MVFSETSCWAEATLSSLRFLIPGSLDSGVGQASDVRYEISEFFYKRPWLPSRGVVVPGFLGVASFICRFGGVVAQ